MGKIKKILPGIALVVISAIVTLGLLFYLSPPKHTTSANINHGVYAKGISCSSATHCVAVGSYSDSNLTQHALVETYNGSNWTITNGIDPAGSSSPAFSSVSCSSATHCVAVGSYTDSSNQTHSLIETYNGTTWAISSGTDPSGATSAVLGSVSCGSSSNCVAVGSYTDSTNKTHSLIESYNGTTWTIVSGTDPSGATSAVLSGVSCTSSNCVTIGYYVNAGVRHILVETYNGTTWAISSGTDPSGAKSSSLSSISCSDSSHCAAVGYYTDNSNQRHTLVETYNGTTWVVASGTDPSGAKSSSLSNISCKSSTNCAAVGSYTDNSDQAHTLVETYNGTTWAISSGTDPSGASNPSVTGIDCSSTTGCLAVGGYTGSTDNIDRLLVESYDGSGWAVNTGTGIQAPTVLKASNVTSTGADLSWHAPDNSGGFSVQEYKVQYQITGASSWNYYETPNSSPNMALLGLLPNTSYTIEVSAINDNAQESPQSSQISFQTANTGSYIINTCQDLQKMNNNLYGGNYVLGQDIDCSDTIHWNGGSGFKPIGSTTPFTGTLNGDGHTISGLYENLTGNNSKAGLFDTIQSGVINNLLLSSSTLRSTDQAGSLAAIVNDSSITNVQIVGGNIITPAFSYCVGGLAGTVEGSYINRTSFVGNLTVGSGCAGGLIGQVVSGQNLSTILNSYAQTEMVYHSPGSGSVGGLVGYSDASIVNSYATGSVIATGSSGDSIGGLIGTNANDGTASIRRSFSHFDIDVTNDSTSKTGGLVGSNAGLASVVDGTDYFDAGLAKVNRCTGDSVDGCSLVNNDAYWAVTNLAHPQGDSINSVTCTSKTNCVAAGYRTDSGGFTHALIETYGGSNWTIPTVTDPSGSASSSFAGVSCKSTTSCVAVGSYLDNSNHTHTLIETYNGTSWSVTTGSDPSGSTDSSLSNVSCSATNNCVAVGSYVDNSSHIHILIETYNGTSWSVTTGSDPSGSINSSLSSIVCKSTTSCVAVGSYNTHNLIETYNGANWTAVTDTDPSGATISSLNSVSCSTVSACVAVGSYTDGSNKVHNLIETYSGSSWAATTDSDPTGSASSSLAGVSCSTANGCVAVGSYTDGGNRVHNLIETYSGSSWTIGMGTDPTGSISSGLSSASCINAISCTTVGSYSNSSSKLIALIETYKPAALNPVYFFGSTTVAPLNSWDFANIWQSTDQLPGFIVGQIVAPVLPKTNPTPTYNYAPRPQVSQNIDPSKGTKDPSSSSKSTSTNGSNSSSASQNPDAYAPDEKGFIGSIKHFIRKLPAGVVVAFPYILFGLLAIAAVIALIELGLELRRIQRLRILTHKQQLLAEERDTFWHLAANYLRAPVTLIVGGAEALTSWRSDDSTKALMSVAKSLQSNVSYVMAEIEGSSTLRGIRKLSEIKQVSTLRRAVFLVPTILIAVFVLLGDYAATNYRDLNPGVLGYLIQLLIFFFAAFAFYWTLSFLARGRSRRRAAEELLARQTKDLSTARLNLIRDTTDRLDPDLNKLEKQLSKLPDETDKSAADGLATAREGAKRLHEILKSFVLLIELQDNSSPILSASTESSGLSEILANAKIKMADTIAANRIRLDYNFNDTQLPGDPELTIQVIESVLDNAIDFSPKGGTVKVDVRQNNAITQIRIHDDGPGVDAKQLSHLFQPFTRTDGKGALSLDHEGVGLNLYLDKLIMDKFGGSIMANSAVGKGMTVTINWPRHIGQDSQGHQA